MTTSFSGYRSRSPAAKSMPPARTTGARTGSRQERNPEVFTVSTVAWSRLARAGVTMVLAAPVSRMNDPCCPPTRASAMSCPGPVK